MPLCLYQQSPPPHPWLRESVGSRLKSCSPQQLWEVPEGWVREAKGGHQGDPPSSLRDCHAGVGGHWGFDMVLSSLL